MSDRIPRPAARLSGGLPDGLTLNGNNADPRTEWEALFGEGDQAPIGPVGASLPNLLEFCLENDIPTSDEPDQPAGEDHGQDEGDQDDEDQADDDGELEDAAAVEEYGGERQNEETEPGAKVVQFSGRT